MRRPFWLNGFLALCVACGAPEQTVDELGVLTQAITETFSGTLALNEVAARGPFAVQPGSQLRVSITGTGDADLYVRFGSQPTLTSYNCRPYIDGSSEQCVLNVPANATSVFVDVRGFTAATYTLSVQREDGSSGGAGGSGGGGSGGGGTPITETFSGTLALNEVAARGPFAVQPGSQLRVSITGTGDADLYVRFGSQPTLTSYNCRPYIDGSSEQCVLTVPATATSVFVDVRGFRASTYALSIERVASSGGGGGSGGTGGSGAGGTGGTGGAGGTGGGSSGGTPITETFSGSVALNEAVARGPFGVQPGSQLRAVLSGSGDADLYVRFGSRPTLTSYDCRPYIDGSSEQCVLTVPASATSVFVDVRGFTAATYSLSLQRVAPAGGGGGGTGGTGGTGGSGGGGAGGSGSQGTDPFVIAVLGSSTAEGEGASSSANSWVGLLQNTLSAVANVSIVNLAAGGYTTLQLLPGSGAFGSIDEAIDEQPDLIVVALAGSNDLSIGTSTATFLSHLTQVRDTARAAGIPTFFVGTAPKNLVDAERFQLADWNEQMGDRFNTCWVPASASYSPCFIDTFADLANDDMEIESQYNAGDGIHLNDAGHHVIFQQAIEIVQPYLCSLTQCG